MQGVITRLYKKRHGRKGAGYGFVNAFDGEDYFFSLKNVTEELNEGDEIAFKACWGDRGGYAKDIKKVID